MKAPISLDVYCLIPYRNRELCGMAPEGEKARRNREIGWAFKNGRAMSKAHRGRPFDALVGRIVRACNTSPLGKRASETLWVPVPRSGESKKSFDPNSDPYPCRTLAAEFAKWIGGSTHEIFNAQRSFRPEKHNTGAALESLKFDGPVPNEPVVILVDDTFVTGASLVACAKRLLTEGYRGKIDAFCVAYDIHRRNAKEQHPIKRCFRIDWSAGQRRPNETPLGLWG